MKHDRVTIYNKFSGCCAYCGEAINIKDMQVDHVIPASSFQYYVRNKTKVPQFLIHLTVDDVNHPDNLFPTCRVCNNWKRAEPLETFRGELQAQVPRLNEYSAQYRIARRYGRVYENNDAPIVFYFETYRSIQEYIKIGEKVNGRETKDV